MFSTYTEVDYYTAYYYDVWSGSELYADEQMFIEWGMMNDGPLFLWIEDT